MIGTALYGGLACALPMGIEVDVFEVAAFGGFDKGKVHAVLPGGTPIDVVLKTGHVDPVDGEGLRIATVEIHRITVAETRREKRAGIGGRRVAGAATGGEGQKRQDQGATEDHGLGFPAIKARLLAGMATSSMGLRPASLSQRAMSRLSL